MDTRDKIIDLDDAKLLADAEDVAVVQMDCDPLLVQHVEFLEGLGRPVLALVATRKDEYAGVDARAELAASLANVRYVALGNIDSTKLIDLRVREREWRQRLERLIRVKSGAR